MQNLTKNQLENKESLSWGLCFGAAFPADALRSSIARRCPPLGPGHLRGSVPIKLGAISRGFSSSTAPRAGKKTDPMRGAQTPR